MTDFGATLKSLLDAQWLTANHTPEPTLVRKNDFRTRTIDSDQVNINVATTYILKPYQREIYRVVLDVHLKKTSSTSGESNVWTRWESCVQEIVRILTAYEYTCITSYSTYLDGEEITASAEADTDGTFIDGEIEFTLVRT